MSGGKASARDRRLQYRRLRAPFEDGGLFFDPPPSQIDALIEVNLRDRPAADVQLLGKPLAELQRQARADLLQMAREYTGRYRDTAWVDERTADRLYLVGHQPELFHPGVWLKNFVLDALARRDGAVGVHLLVDNDQVADASLRVPAGSPGDPRIEQVAIDRPGVPTSWEDREILDADLFRTFGRRVAETISPLVADPLIVDLWRQRRVDALFGRDCEAQAAPRLGLAVARLRHQLEADWGLQTLEVPLSALYRLPAYGWFVAFVLASLPRLLASHNAALAEYRRVHRLRNRSHPVPDLGTDGDWLEAPLWISAARDPSRRRLYARTEASQLTLSDRNGLTIDLPGRPAEDGSRLAEALARLKEIRIRPRALMTTMFARLLLGELFIHGIGGAKYDQVTDCLIEDLLGIRPPGFLTVSGTRLLPVQRPTATADDLRRIDDLLRELRFQPDQFIDMDRLGAEKQKVRRLIEEKRRWLSQDVSPEQRRERHAAISRANDALADYVSSRREELAWQRGEIARQIDRRALLESREYSFCLFSEASLRAWLLDGAAKAL